MARQPRYSDLTTRRGPTKRKYEVRVYRRYDEEYADIEVMAASEDEAKALAEKEARANHSLWFGSASTPGYEAVDVESI